MATPDSVWLVHQPEQIHLLPHARDCAQHLWATLEPAVLASFIANAADYSAKSRRMVALLESADLRPLLQGAITNGHCAE